MDDEPVNDDKQVVIARIQQDTSRRPGGLSENCDKGSLGLRGK
jgi:hypothetical protein